MNRRESLRLIAGALAAPITRAQQSGRVARIGRLCQGECPVPAQDQFFAAPRALGWVEGRNLEEFG